MMGTEALRTVPLAPPSHQLCPGWSWTRAPRKSHSLGLQRAVALYLEALFAHRFPWGLTASEKKFQFGLALLFITEGCRGES